MAVHDLFDQFPRDAYVTGVVCCSDAHFTVNSASHSCHMPASPSPRQIPGGDCWPRGLTLRTDVCSKGRKMRPAS